MRLIESRLFFTTAVLFVLRVTCFGNAADDGRLELAKVKLVTGGAAWDNVFRISATGEKVSFGLRGAYHSIETLPNGFFEVKADYGLITNAEGVDSSGRWRQDNSGQIHPLDSAEAKAVAVTEVYLAARGYLFPERTNASISTLSPVKDGKQIFLRIVAKPKDGRAVTLWVDSASHLIARAIIELSVGEKKVTYGDYRPVGLLFLPFTITIERRDENETGVATIRDYKIVTGSRPSDLVKPEPVILDVAMVGDAKEARTQGYLDRASGFFVVYANLNGQGPFPFILDTGGHDIVTPSTVRKLGMRSYGSGFSTGAGAGSTPTQFTKINEVAIGPAIIKEQPFTILHIDLGTVTDRSGKSQPIAGILGLELFERFVVTIDYQNELVIFSPRSVITCSADSRIPIRFTSDMPVVQASIDEHDGWFNVDTGNNTDLIVFETWANSKGLASSPAKPEAMQGSSVGGGFHMVRGHAQVFQLGKQRLPDIALLFASEKEGSLSANWEAGNIGNSVLRHFRVTFDYGSGWMCLE